MYKYLDPNCKSIRIVNKFFTLKFFNTVVGMNYDLCVCVFIYIYEKPKKGFKKPCKPSLKNTQQFQRTKTK